MTDETTFTPPICARLEREYTRIPGTGTRLVNPDGPEASAIIKALYEALDGLLKHAGIADAAAEDIDGEDHARESAARRALALTKATGQ